MKKFPWTSMEIDVLIHGEFSMEIHGIGQLMDMSAQSRFHLQFLLYCNNS